MHCGTKENAKWEMEVRKGIVYTDVYNEHRWEGKEIVDMRAML